MATFFYVVLSLLVAGVALKFLKTTWVYFVVAVFLPPMLMIGGDALWQGRLDAWDHIVFVVLALIAFGIALGLFLVRLVWLKMRSERPPPEQESPR